MSSDTEAKLLRELNEEIARAEDRGDAAFFEQLLHERFAMLRPMGAWEGRDGFISRLVSGGSRRSGPAEVHLFGNRASVWCVVDKRDGETLSSNHNLRTFVRTGRDEPWQLVAWLNEPESGQHHLAVTRGVEGDLGRDASVSWIVAPP